jgi:predicted ATPase/DNA-binding CsgD family transcriptional regulator
MPIDSIRPRLHRLPVPLTPLVGRQRDITAIRELIDTHAGLRLISLTGPAGVGKTRLALKIAADYAADFPDAVTFVPLATIGESALVIPSIARALLIPERDRPQDVESIAGVIGNRADLLVIDNFEQVLNAGPELRTLLDACPRLRILVTSRTALRLSVEQEYPVDPLGLPVSGLRHDLDTLAGNDAVALFLQRARAARPSFELTAENAGDIVEICRRLDGLPLAIELAAARSRMLSPRALIARLSHRLDILSGGARDLPLRHQTMRDAIAWSYELLPPEASTLYARLSAFIGGFTLEAAEQVATDGDLVIQENVLEGIATLIDASLLRQDTGPDDEPRYLMLSTIREFGLERLNERDDADAVRRRHAEWVMAFAEEAETGFYSADQVPWLNRLEVERDNIRAALQWTTSAGEADLSLRVSSATWCLWRVRGHRTEGRDWMEKALTIDGAYRLIDRAKALDTAGDLAWVQRDFNRARQLHGESLMLARKANHPFGIGRALFGLADVALSEHEPDLAEEYLEEALQIYRTIGNVLWEATCLVNIGQVARIRGDDLAASGLISRAIELFRRIGYAWGGAWAIAKLANIKRDGGDLAAAATLYREAADLSLNHNDRSGVAHAIEGLALVAARANQCDLAARLFGASQQLADGVGHPLPFPTERQAALVTIEREIGGLALAGELETGRRFHPSEAVVEAGKILFTIPAPVRQAPVPAPLPQNAHLISPRELEVLKLLADGKSSHEIADELYISHRTVTTHISNILGKLGVDSRAAAIAVALRSGIV